MAWTILAGRIQPVVLMDEYGNFIDAGNPLYVNGVLTGTVTVTDVPLVYGALQTALMGNAGPLEVVAANANRRALVLTNISASIGYYSIGNGVGLTTTNYLFRLYPGESLIFSPPISQQQLFAVCGVALQNVTYQEAV